MIFEPLTPYDIQKKNLNFNESLRQTLRKKDVYDYIERYKLVTNMLNSIEEKMKHHGSAFVMEGDVKEMLWQLELKAKSQDSNPRTYKNFILDGFEHCNVKIKCKIQSDFEHLCSENLALLGFQEIQAHAEQNRIDITAYKDNILFDIGCHGNPKSMFCSGDIFKDTLALCIQSIGYIDSADVLQDMTIFYKENGFRNITLAATSKTDGDGDENIISGIVEKNDIQCKLKLIYDHEMLSSKYYTYNSKASHNEIIDFDNMEGHQFEFFCAELLKRNGYENVAVTQGSGDQGIDVIAYRDGIKYGIQCKCYSTPIGNQAVQEVFAGKVFYQCHVGIVLTNNYFTKAAVELAKHNGVVLWNRDKLLQMIGND